MAESHHENSDVLADGSLTEHQGVPIIRPEHETRVLVGTCNWSDHESFYPRGLKPGDRLAFYADRFTIVEVDSTYYHLQPPTYFARWAARTPAGFVFNVKAFKELTWHDRDQAPRDSTFAAFAEALQPLRDADKLRAIHFQFPPWYVANQKNRDYLLLARDQFPKDLLAVEFRHRSWFTSENQEATLGFLREGGFAHVVVDAPQIGSGTVPSVVAVTSPRLSIVRFHGRNTQTWYKKAETTGDRFNYLYSQQELAEWLPAVRALASEAAEVHLLMNNNHADYAVRNAADMMRLLGQAAPDLAVPKLADSATYAAGGLFDTDGERS